MTYKIDKEKREKGLKIMEQMGLIKSGDKPISRDFMAHIVDALYGTIWSRNEVIDLQERSLITVAVLVALNRENIFIRDSFNCQYCGKEAESIDHVIPKSKGGSHEWNNVVACCKKCNLLKADKLLSKTVLNLKKIPSIPEGNFWIKTIIGNNPDPDWKEYLVTQ